MTTRTVRNTGDQSTQSATDKQRPTKPSADDPDQSSREYGEVAQAVERDIAAIAKHSPDLARSALAASTMALAREMDNAGNSATSKSMCAKALLETLDRLRELLPTDQEADELDDLAARRARRIAGGATS